MKEGTTGTPASVPALVSTVGARADDRFREFFASEIRNPHTLRAYARAIRDFLTWCAGAGVASIIDVEPRHVASWIELQTAVHANPTVKQQLAALRHLFDWLITGQIMSHNPAVPVRGPGHSPATDPIQVLDTALARQLLESIDATTPVGLRDRALIALMAFSSTRIGTALSMRVGDLYVQHRRLWIRLRERDGNAHEIPCHQTLETYLHAYLEHLRSTGTGDDPKGPLFRTIRRGTGRLSASPLPQANAHAMVRRRSLSAGIGAKIAHQTYLTTCIAPSLQDDGTQGSATAIPDQSSTFESQLNNMHNDDISLDEVVQIHLLNRSNHRR